MTIEEFNEYIRKQPLQTYIVEIKLKYQYEKEYRYTNEILRVENGCDYVWLQDWNEGEEDVEILNCVALNDIDLSLQWIPCSERLPEPNKPVIVTSVGKYKSFVSSVDWLLPDSTEWNYCFRVIAWMPLPEPWKEKI